MQWPPHSFTWSSGQNQMIKLSYHALTLRQIYTCHFWMPRPKFEYSTHWAMGEVQTKAKEGWPSQAVQTSQFWPRLMLMRSLKTLVKSMMPRLATQAERRARSMPATCTASTYSLTLRLSLSATGPVWATQRAASTELRSNLVLLVQQMRTLQPQGLVSSTRKYLLFWWVSSYMPVRVTLQSQLSLLKTSTFQQLPQLVFICPRRQEAITGYSFSNICPPFWISFLIFTFSFSLKLAESSVMVRGVDRCRMTAMAPRTVRASRICFCMMF